MCIVPLRFCISLLVKAFGGRNFIGFAFWFN